MGLADFWDNITTPGFLSNAFDELKELCGQFKKEAQERIEEGEELFTDGFKGMVLHNNNGYKTSIEMREDGRKTIDSLQTACLERRGIDSDSLPVVQMVDYEFAFILESMAESPGDEIHRAIAKAQGEFKQLIFTTPDDLQQFRSKAVALLTLPEPPAYEAPPPSERIRLMGPVGIVTSDKQKRKAAAKEFLNRIVDYAKVMELEAENWTRDGTAPRPNLLHDA